jgi:hypothetical protein
MISPVRSDDREPTIDLRAHELEVAAAQLAVELAEERIRIARSDTEAPAETAEPRALVDNEADELEMIETALGSARRRAARPFGKSAAKRVAELELAHRLILDRVGRSSYDSVAVDPDDVIDLDELEVAHDEWARAEVRLAQALASNADTAPPLPRRQRPWRPVTLPPS